MFSSSSSKLAPPQPLSAASICSSWLCVHLRPPSGVIAVRPTGRLRTHAQQSRAVAATVWSNRSRTVSFRLVQPRAPTMRREHGSHPRASNVRWPPKSQANPTRHRPVSKIQPNPRKQRASKAPSIREEDEPEEPEKPEKPEKPENAYDVCRYLQRASHQDAPFSRSGFAVGVLRHNLGIKLDQASTFSPSGFCIRPGARTAREPDLDGRERGAVLADRRPRVAPCALCRR